MNLKTRFTTAIATGAVLLNALAPMAFAQSTDIQISGNGAFSDNKVDVDFKNETTVNQENKATIKNDVDVDANTGKNDANFNTGGDTTINTGDANVDVNISNVANKNIANVENCCQENVDVLISGNGAFSDNDVYLDSKNKTYVNQDNNAYIKNDVDVDANTGKNDANFNTGGDVTLSTGDANVGVGLLTAVNANSATVGGDGEGGTLSARIMDNGAFSDNKIDLDFYNKVYLDQDNKARIYNDVDVDADTGKNDANFNTGGDIDLLTGDANVDVDVHNLANFNFADIDNCGCFEDVSASIDGNGAYSDNDIYADFKDITKVWQDNYLRLHNDVDVDADTGKNDAEFNTNGDTTISTGDEDVNVDLNNHSNVNLLGSDSDDLMGLLDDLLDHVNLSFDMSFLMALMHHLHA